MYGEGSGGLRVMVMVMLMLILVLISILVLCYAMLYSLHLGHPPHPLTPSIHPSIHPALLRAERGSKLHVGSARVWSRDLCKGAGCSDGLPAMVEGLLPPEMRLHKRAAGNRAALFLRPPFLFSRQDRCIIYYPCFLVTDETRSSNFHTSIISHIERSRTYIHLYFVVFASPIYKPPSNSISISISLTLFPTHSFIPPPPPPAPDKQHTPSPPRS